MIYNELRFIAATLALDFVNKGLTMSSSFFTKADLEIDDPVLLPPGKVVRIKIEYIDERETEQ